MKKDISFPTVSGVFIAIVRKRNEINEFEWTVHLINQNAFPLTQVMVTSRGYGEMEGEPRETSVLRHAFVEIETESHQLIETIHPMVFPLCNEYWVSYFINEQIYDKRFIFVPDSIVESNIRPIPLMKEEGVLHE